MARIRDFGVLALWIVGALVLSAITVRVTDWFVMTDELLYERLAISIAQGHSPLPEVRGELIRSLGQLYPLLIAPAFVHGSVFDDLRQAHFLNAWIMSSACIPAFLLARRVTGRRWAAYVVSMLTLLTPWLVYAPFLLTEVAAYPAFLWAVFALQCAVATPSRRNDALALAGIAVAFLARTEFVALAFVLPLAILARSLQRAESGSLTRRAWQACRTAVTEHRLLAVVYAALAVVALALLAGGASLSSFTVYGDQIHGSLIPPGTPRAFIEHLATVSLGIAVLPFVVGLAWLLANLVRGSANEEWSAFACIGAFAVAILTLEVTTFDLRVGDFVHDRYLFYLLPLVLLAFVCALLDSRRPRWSLMLPAGVIAFAFATGAQPGFTWSDPFGRLNTDTPISVFYGLAGRAAHGLSSGHTLLAAATLVLVALFLACTSLLRHRYAVVVLVAFALVVIPAETAYTLSRLLRTDDWASRPLTGPRTGLDWVDARLGAATHAAMVPAPIAENVFESQQSWRDLEFWNKAVDRDVHYPTANDFRFTGIFFPKTVLGIDDSKGTTDVSPAPYVVQSARDTRFRIAGPVRAQRQGMLLIDAGRAWRLDWRTFGLFDDGWTQPGAPARVRVFATPGQRGARVRFLTLQVRAPSGVAKRPFRVVSNLEARDGDASGGATAFVNGVRVCVPAGGFSDVRLRADGVSPIPGDLGSVASVPRAGGVLLALIAVADELGPACRPAG